MDAFVISSLPSPMLETLQMAGPLRSADITPLHRYYGPSRHPLVFADFPVSPVIRPTLLRRFRAGRGGLLQLLSMSLSPCCRFHPAEVNIRIGQSSAAHAAFALRFEGSALGILIFEATMRSLLLRPGDS